jgi:hypothetical protein
VRRRFVIAAALTAGAAPGATWAQGGHGHAHTGQEQRIGAYEVALLVRSAEAILAISDERDQPVDGSRFSATAVALARGNERRTVEFRPAGANRLAAKLDFPFDGKFRATVNLRGPDGDIGQARFNVDPAR